MQQAILFLPGIDAAHLRKYFQDDRNVIAEIFSISNGTIEDDLAAVRQAFEAADLYSFTEAIHKIKPGFSIVGMVTLENEIGQFYSLCLGAASFDDLNDAYSSLWPKLVKARQLIAEQAKFFEQE